MLTIKKEYYLLNKAAQFGIDGLLFLCLVISEYLSNGVSDFILMSMLAINNIVLNISSHLTADSLILLSKTLTGYVLLATAGFRFYYVIKNRNKKE